MYVYYFVHLVGTPSEWAQRLEEARSQLSDLAADALADEAHDGRGGDSSLDLGQHRRQMDGFLIPIRWAAKELFNPMSGDLSLQPVASGVTQVTLRASYAPTPRGDSVAGHRLVETTVKRFLDSLESLAA